MGRKNRSANLLSNLPQLQNLIKRDPQSYQEEFSQQLHHFEASLAIFELKPDEEASEFGEVISFLAQVAKCYPKQSARFPTQLIELVQKHYPVLDADLRRTIVQALILLRSRGVVSNLRVMPLFFTLFRCHDKGLRKLLYTHIVNDVKNANKGRHRNHKLNAALQGFMYTMITAADAQDKLGEGALAAKKSLDVCIDLYRKGIWTDAKAVNVIAQACFSPITKIMMTAVQFFLHPQKHSGGGDGDGSGSEGEDDKDKTAKTSSVNLRLVQHMSNVNRKTKSRQRALERATRLQRRMQAKRDGRIVDSDEEEDAMSKKSRKKRQLAQAASRFDVLSLIHDPQGFVEKLFARVHSATTATKRGGSKVDRFEVRLAVLKLISRLIGHQQLQFVAFYPFFQRYLQPHQTEVTQLLAMLATATNAFTPPDVLQPLIRAIADNFVSDHCAPEVMCAGLNTIRAIAFRQPLSVEPDLLNDLIMYRKHKDKGVMMAARSLLALYREVNPEMLHRRDRGRDATMELKNGAQAAFGEQRAADGVAGIELLEMYEQKKSAAAAKAAVKAADGASADADGDDGWGEWEEAGSGSESGSESDDESESDAGSESEGEDGSDAEAGWVSAGSEAEIELGSSDIESEIELGDSEDEGADSAEDAAAAAAAADAAAAPESKQRIDMVRFLTNEDFDRIDKLKKRQAKQAQAQAQAQPRGKKRARAMADEGNADGDGDNDDASSESASDAMMSVSDASSDSGSDAEGEKEYVSDWEIIGDYHTRKRRIKATYEERVDAIKASRSGREKFGSKKGKREKEGRSLSNKEKRKTKSFAMVSHKRGIVSKGKRSMVHKRHDLRRHITKQKKNGF